MNDSKYRRLAACANAHLQGLTDRRESGPDSTDEDCPSIFSGEWAGESIPEMFGIPVGQDWDVFALSRYGVMMDTLLDEIEAAYAEGWLLGGR